MCMYFILKINSVLGISQQRLLDRCAFRTGRLKTRRWYLQVCFLLKLDPFAKHPAKYECIMCFRYGTGCFLLRNTGVKVLYLRLEFKHCGTIVQAFTQSATFLVSAVLQPVMSEHGLLTTVAYKLGRDKPACYALEVQYIQYI